VNRKRKKKDRHEIGTGITGGNEKGSRKRPTKRGARKALLKADQPTVLHGRSPSSTAGCASNIWRLKPQ